MAAKLASNSRLQIYMDVRSGGSLLAHLVSEQDGRVPDVATQLDQDLRLHFGNEVGHDLAFVFSNVDEEVVLICELVHCLEDKSRVALHRLEVGMGFDKAQKVLFAAIV